MLDFLPENDEIERVNLDIRWDRSRPIHLQISEHLRRRIETGAIGPGQALPSTTALGRMWGVNFRTVHKALNRLKKSGLLHRTPGLGTRVAAPAKPVSLAVLFGPDVTAEGSHFYRAVLNAIRHQAEERNWTSRVYDGLYRRGRRGFQQTPAHRLFAEDRAYREFNAVIAVSVKVEHYDALKLSLPVHTARFRIFSSGDVGLDFPHFVMSSVEHLVQKGLRHIVYVSTLTSMDKNSADIAAWAAARRRFGIRPGGFIRLETSDDFHKIEPDTYRLVTRHILKWRKTGRWPQAIIISDDVAMRALALALIRHQVKVPEQLQVLTWANEGISHHYGIPVIRYVVSPAEIARRLMEILEKRRAGESPRNLPVKIRGRIVDEEKVLNK
jgi:DNA-binding transcriptional regulator YhcF (GntR family)